MDDRLMYIPNANAQNYPFGRLQLVVETFGLDKPTNQIQKPFKSPQNI